MSCVVWTNGDAVTIMRLAITCSEIWATACASCKHVCTRQICAIHSNLIHHVLSPVLASATNEPLVFDTALHVNHVLGEDKPEPAWILSHQLTNCCKADIAVKALLMRGLAASLVCPSFVDEGRISQGMSAP